MPHDPIAPSERIAPKPRPVLLSSPPLHAERIRLGAPGYGEAIAAAKFARMFRAHGVAVSPVAAPEQLKHPAALRLIGLDAGAHLHLICREPAQIRIIPGAYNVGWFARPTLDAADARMLRGCDEVWTTSPAMRRVLAARGVARVHVVPAPVPAPAHDAARGTLGELAWREAVPLVSSSAIDEALFREIARRHATPLGECIRLRAALGAGRLFVTVADPGDPRTDLATLLDGFLNATRDTPDAALLVKLIGPPEFDRPAAHLFHRIRPLLGTPHCLHEDGVLLLAGEFAEAEMERLFRLADFYLRAPRAEGRGMALAEAMAQGCVPVSPTTGCLDATSAVPIAARRRADLAEDGAAEAGRPARAPEVSDRHQVAAAVRAALALDDAARAARARAARATIARGHDDAAVFATLCARLGATRPDVVPAAMPPRADWWR